MTIVNHTISRQPLLNTSTGWSDFEKVSFRFAFIFILLLVIPLSREWYDRLSVYLGNRDSIRVVLDRLDETYLTGIEWHIRNTKYTYP